VEANHSPHKFAWFSGDPARYEDLLVGRVIQSACYLGGNVEVQLGGINLLYGASLRVHQPGERLPAKHQLLLKFRDGSALSASIQMWGALLCYEEGRAPDFMEYALAVQKPSPLSPAFERKHFDQLFSEDTPKLSAKAFLATEQRIPGLGNGVLQDILWSARIHPRRKMAALSEQELDEMFRAIKCVLQQMVEQGGRDTEKDLFGCQGGYQTVASKYAGKIPCPGCASPFRKEAYLGGSIYYCPGCQPL
jgi:formamidopyrimidine-DNA glycosylase